MNVLESDSELRETVLTESQNTLTRQRVESFITISFVLSSIAKVNCSLLAQLTTRHVRFFFMMTAFWFLTFLSQSSGYEGPGVSDGIAAIVNTEVITLSEIHDELRDEEKRLRARYRGEELTRRLHEKEYEALNSLIEQKLQLQEAKVKGFTVTEEELHQTIQDLRKRGEVQGDPTTELMEQLRQELLLVRLIDFEVRRHVMISEEELRQFYKEKKDRLFSQPVHHLRQILLRPKPEVTMAKLRDQAASIHLQLKMGANFEDLARRYSDGSESVRGGDLGTIRDDELLVPIKQVLDQLKPGEFSKPVETSLGIHLILLVKTSQAPIQSFEEVQRQIRELLYRQKAEEMYRVWIADLKNKAYIEVKF